MPTKKAKRSVNRKSDKRASPAGASLDMTEELIFRQHRFLNRHRDDTGTARDDLWRKGIRHLRRMRVNVERSVTPAFAAPPPVPTVTGGVRWKQVGPQPLRIDARQNFQGTGPVSGEVVDLAIDPRGASDQIIYIATNDGGIWKTTDGGATWQPKTDLMPSLSMGAVALDPNNPDIIYAGTGNPFDGGNVFTKGVGVYRSTDAGETWLQLGDTTAKGLHPLRGLNINRIALPRSEVLLVATNAGLFRSVDGGQNFGANVPQFDDGNPVLPGDITDVDLDTATPASIAYASVRGVGIMVSINGGITFPTNLFNNPGAPAAPFDQIVIAQSVQPDNKTIYALVTDSTINPAVAPQFKGMFVSTDTGANWAPAPGAAGPAADNSTATHKGLQANYDVMIGVDPQNASRVYIAFQELYVSTDGGMNFGMPAISRGKIHFDHHALRFSPHIGAAGTTPFYVGTDGGISRSDDGGTTWANLNETIGTNLFIGIDIGRGNAANNQVTFGGCQDTGTVERLPAFAGTDWHLGENGDGGPVAVDTSNPQQAYGRTNGILMVTNNGGTSWSFPTSATTGLPSDPNGSSLATPLGVDLNTPANVYVTQGNQLFQSTNSGGSFAAINNFPASIRAFALVKLDSKVAMVGCSDGSVHRTTNLNAGAGSIWNNVTAALTAAGAPPLPVGGIAIDPTDTNTAIAVLDGFTLINPANRTAHVFRTTDGGANWTDISGTDGAPNPDDNLPDLPLHSVVIDPTGAPHAIIVAGDSGVMRSIDNGATWQIFGVGLPVVDCTSLAIDAAAAPPVIRVGTYGRSVFEIERPTGPVIAVRSNLAFGSVAQGSSADLPVQVFNVGTTDLVVSDFFDLSGAGDFQLVAPPPFPVTVAPGSELDFTLRFAPTKSGNQQAPMSITSNDPAQPALAVRASGSSPSTVPTVTGLNPASGPAAGGTAVQISGTGFTGASAVLFGAAGATSFTVDSDIQITAVSPAGAGIVDVLVTGATGTSVPSAGSRFTYGGGGGLALTGLSPTEGPETGGTAVTITGTGFGGATQVLFGAIGASGFTVDSDTQITAVSPAGNGTVDVLVVTPSATSVVTPADRFRYTVPGGGVSTGTGTTTTTGVQTGGPPDANSEILSALADILRTGTDPEVLEAQRILLRRIALGGDIVQSRIPAPKNITEIGGYINLLGTLEQPELRLQMLASVLGVAGESATLGLTETGPIAAFVSTPNDRPEGPAQPLIPPRFTVRSDMIDALQDALQLVHGVGCAVPFLTPARALPRPLPGTRPQSDFLALLGRTLDVVPGTMLGDPANDPLAIARLATDPPTAFQLVAREIDGGASVAEASWIAFSADTASVTVQPAANRRYLPLKPLFATAGWYPVEPVVLPTSLVDPGSMVRFINVSGLVRDETRLGQELALLYPVGAIMTSTLVAQLSWIWNGTTFVPPR